MSIVETYHKKLLKYKNKHIDETCYIFGSGPSINKFKIQEKGIFIGCNHIIKNDYIRSNLKYYFFGHGYIDHNNDNDKLYGNHKKEVNNLEYDIEKFAMVSRNNDLNVHRFTQETINELYNINAIPCDLNLTNYYTDLDKNPFMNHSIVLPACQFALYAGFKTIYLVGCDCSGYYHSNSFDLEDKNNQIDTGLIDWWSKLYIHKKTYYPKTKIINLNPVGLKELMDDDLILT